MKMFYILVVLCLSGDALASATTPSPFEAGPCPDPETMVGMDIEKFMGRWYQQLDSTGGNHDRFKCVREDYSLEENSTISRISTSITRTTGIMISIPSVMHPVDPAEPAKMLTQQLGTNKKFIWRVLDTDYVSYAFMYSCISVEMGEMQHVMQGAFFTRDQNANEALIAKGNELIEKYNFDKSKYSQIKQSDCVMKPSK